MGELPIQIPPELIDELRKRYTPPQVPSCRVCGGRLSVQACGGGEPTRYACSGQEDDPDRPGCVRPAPGRWGNAAPGTPSEYAPGGHYHDSKWTDYRQGGDPSVIALLDLIQPPSTLDKNG